MKINFRYIDYNDENNRLIATVYDYIKENNLIITEDGMSKNFLFSYVNSKKIRVFDNFLSLDEFLEKIFLSNKYILKDIKRFLIFYASLTKEVKNNLNIRTYYDCIEIADDFFDFFTYIKDRKIFKKLNLSKWQKEKIDIFYQIKEDFDKNLNENNFLPLDWLYTKENLNLFYLKKFKKIIFYDVLDFPHNFFEILLEISKYLEIEIVLQVKKEDYDEKKLKLKDLNLPIRNIKLGLVEYKDDFDLYNLIEKNLKENSKDEIQIYSANLNTTDNYSIFSESNRHIFNDTKLYKILETYIKILETMDLQNKMIDTFKLKDSLFNTAFMEFYGLDIEDYKNFEKILEDDYRYISYNLLEKGYFDYYFKENKNLFSKLKLILKNAEEIDNISNIIELSEYFKEKFFSNEADINYFFEGKYTSIYDKFYEILGILNSNKNIEYFKNFSNFFEKNIGKNIFILFFNYLNKITLYTNIDSMEEESKLNLKDLYSAKFFLQQQSKKNLIIHTDNQNLAKSKKINAIFTEQQKNKLGIKNYEDLILIEKYRTFQNLLNFSDVEIYSIVDLDNNIDFSSFIYEYANRYNAFKKSYNVDFIQNLFEEKNDLCKKDKPYFRAYKKDVNDFKNGILKIGAYDYTALLDGETFFFLEKLCKLGSQLEVEEVNGISAKLLGIILHKTMEDLFKKNWKDVLLSPENILIKKENISETLRKNLKKEELKIESFMKNYLEEILILRLEKNIENFLNFLYEELKDTKILRIEVEKTDKKELAFCEINGIQVFFSGRADLLIETSKANYIIDFKTGLADKRQLEFYAVMFYGDRNISVPIYSFSYNFWKEDEQDNIELEKNKIADLNGLKNQIKENIEKFLGSSIYELPKKSKLKENKFDFKKSYNYKYLCPLDKIQGDENE
ncbi:MAG: PD-(D/E)XK nuclease family protein [Fusobacterium sp.]|uniref:PD-(D/E)XK nuclease family protein n=1 Tax=Fusobacterium sp. TaxID=68766 RepID=UPI0026DCC97D|nr:PD-(D/E)XK nuclease family protein [Fusobacterium sp.]MDO4690187.1 PD-(D/E)XK nuclease family protein [Fusobacterium sp.]